jgi:hypothetical protein
MSPHRQSPGLEAELQEYVFLLEGAKNLLPATGLSYKKFKTLIRDRSGVGDDRAHHTIWYGWASEPPLFTLNLADKKFYPSTSGYTSWRALGRSLSRRDRLEVAYRAWEDAGEPSYSFRAMCKAQAQRK